MITKAEGSTFRMLSKDKRVESVYVMDGKAVVVLSAPWFIGEGNTSSSFDDWESARNWVRKAVEQKELL